MAFVTPGNEPTTFVFGGYTETADGQRHVANDLWKFHNGNWERVDTSGDIPAPRLVGAMVADPHKNVAYLFGGWNADAADSSDQILDTVHALNLETMEWKILDCKLPDGPTSRHVAVVTPSGRIVLHTHRCIDHVIVFDPSNHSFSKQTTTGTAPSSRGLHAATAFDDTTICIFGGASQDQTMSNECFFLDTDTWKWTKVPASDDMPRPRAAPVICSHQGCVFMFGGAEATQNGLNPLDDLWKLTGGTTWDEVVVEDGATVPPSRNAATLTETSEGFLLTGGWDPFRETRDDSHLLHVNH